MPYPADAAEFVEGLELSHELEAGLVGKADIGNDQVESTLGGLREGGGGFVGRNDCVFEGGEDAGAMLARVFDLRREGYGVDLWKQDVKQGECRGEGRAAGMVGRTTVKVVPLPTPGEATSTEPP